MDTIVQFFDSDEGTILLFFLALGVPAALLTWALTAGPRAWFKGLKDDLRPLPDSAKCSVCKGQMVKGAYSAVHQAIFKLLLGLVILGVFPAALLKIETLILTVPLAGLCFAGIVRAKRHVLKCTGCGHFVPRMADL